MAITKQITKVDVKESSGNKAITLRVTVSDNGVPYDEKDFVIDFNQSDDIEEMVKKIQSKMQTFINDTVENINYFNHVKLDAAVTFLNANTTL